jgi:hypothetical protein
LANEPAGEYPIYPQISQISPIAIPPTSSSPRVTRDSPWFVLPMSPLTVILWLAFGYVGGWIAARKGSAPRAGIVLGVLFGPMALLVGACLPPTKEGRQQAEYERQLAESPRRANCPECGREIPYGSTICPHREYKI